MTGRSRGFAFIVFKVPTYFLSPLAYYPIASMHAVWHPFYHPESCSKEVSGLVAASAQEAHVIKGKRVNILKVEVEKLNLYVEGNLQEG